MKKYLAFAAVIVLAGCGTLFHGSFQKVQVVTPGIVGADCSLETPKRKYRAITPQTIQVDRSEYAMSVLCSKVGYKLTTLTVPAKLAYKDTWMNVFNGVIPGTAYDAESKALYSYPKEISVQMEVDPDALKSADVSPEPVSTIQRKESAKSLVEQAAPESSKADKSFSSTLRK